MRVLLLYFLAILPIWCSPYAAYADDAPSRLLEAIQSGATPAEIQELIEGGADVNEIYCEMLRAYKPVLRYALDRGSDEESMEVLSMLIDVGADVNERTYNRVENKAVYGMMPLISYAVIYSSPSVVQLFIDAGADVNRKLSGSSIDSNKTPLQYAHELGKQEVAAMLEEAGAKSSAQD